MTIDQIKDIQEVKEKNKADHYSFPDNNTYFSSVYKEHFNKNMESSSQQRNNERQRIKNETNKQMVELRASHILYGTDHSHFHTTHRNSFPSVASGIEKVKGANISKTNFIFGNDEQPTESLYKSTHQGKQTEKMRLDPKIVQDFRSINTF